MNIKNFSLVSILLLMVSCGGGGGGYNPDPPVPSLTNLNPSNDCKKAWYTSTFPDPTSIGTVFNNYTFFWQSTSFKDMPICINTYEVTDSITSTGGVSWTLYAKELIEYSKRTLGQIVPLNVFILGANPQNTVTSTEKAAYNTDFATVQAPVGANYNTALANYDGFPIDSAGGGYSHEAAPNGADIQIPQSLVWGQGGFGSDAEQIQQSFKVIAHEYFHVYQNSIKFYNEASKSISLPKAWFSNPSLLDPASASTPAYFPWWIEEGGAEFGGIVLSAKYANTKAGITVDPVQQFEDHFNTAFDHFDSNGGASLSDFNLTGNVGYSAGATALLYLWSIDSRNFNAAMSKYYTDWQEAEKARSGNGWQDAFEDAFWKNNTEYYTLENFVTEFDSWIRGGAKADLFNAIKKTAAEIIHADIVPTTVNTEPSPYSIEVSVAAKVVGSGTGNRYFIDGVQQKTLVVKAGQTYKFNVPNISNHPFKFSTNVDGTNNPGDEYTTNVSVSGTEVTIVIPASGVSNLYYYCSIHPGMGGRIVIKDQTSGGGVSSGSY